MNSFGLLVVVVLSCMSSLGYASFKVADLPDRDIIESVIEIETKYLGLGDNNSGSSKVLQPSETLQRLQQLHKELNRTLLVGDEGLERRAKVVQKLVEYGQMPEDSCDELDFYEPAIWSGMMDKARNIMAYLKFYASTRIARCSAVELNRAKGGLTLDTWKELQQLMGHIYGDVPQEGKEVPTPMTVAKGVVEYMRKKRPLPLEEFRKQFGDMVEPLCTSFIQALGPAAGVFGRYTKSELSDAMSKKDVALLNYYEVCSRAQAHLTKAYEFFNAPNTPVPVMDSAPQLPVAQKVQAEQKSNGYKWIQHLKSYCFHGKDC